MTKVSWMNNLRLVGGPGLVLGNKQTTHNALVDALWVSGSGCKNKFRLEISAGTGGLGVAPGVRPSICG